MQNIEVKAKYPNLERAQQIAETIGAHSEGTLRQVDTYFSVKQGRFKLREIDAREAQLIYYQRPDRTEAKLSEYHIYPVQDAQKLKGMLEAALGIWCVVEKRRQLYWYHNVRIHLDSVYGLGDFIEFEGVLKDGAKASQTADKVDWLTSKFEISEADLIEGSYSDLLCRGDS